MSIRNLDRKSEKKINKMNLSTDLHQLCFHLGAYTDIYYYQMIPL